MPGLQSPNRLDDYEYIIWEWPGYLHYTYIYCINIGTTYNIVQPADHSFALGMLYFGLYTAGNK